jgi:hypothetical protein
LSDERQDDFAGVIGAIPYRMALAGGWIDQPFVSRRNPEPPGSMVVVGLEPNFRYMDRAGMATGTREVARKLWKDVLPGGDPSELVRTLYEAENKGRSEPSGSQDMVGLIFPGVSRLDYHSDFEGGFFPAHIESNTDPGVAHWIEEVIHVLPVAQRPPDYNPLGEKCLDPEWIRRLGQSGKDCYAAILAGDRKALGQAMNGCMRSWEAILPHTVRHPTINVDLMALLNYYQSHYDGAMYSGCGGGYLYVVSQTPVPGSFNVTVRVG